MEEEAKKKAKKDINKKDKTFKLGFYDYTLLRSKKPVEDCDKEAYFNDFKGISNGKNQKSFIESMDINFHEYVIIKIATER